MVKSTVVGSLVGRNSVEIGDAEIVVDTIEMQVVHMLVVADFPAH